MNQPPKRRNGSQTAYLSRDLDKSYDKLHELDNAAMRADERRRVHEREHEGLKRRLAISLLQDRDCGVAVPLKWRGWLLEWLRTSPHSPVKGKSFDSDIAVPYGLFPINKAT